MSDGAGLGGSPLSEGRRKLVLRLHRRKTREREGLVLVDGAKAVADALALGARGRFLVRSPRGHAPGSADLEARIAQAGLQVFQVSDAEMGDLSHTETPQGVLLVAEEPEWDADRAWDPASARLLLLDGVQDPGNAGALVRVAAALGCSAVVALDGTADLWSPRAVRGAAATGFALPLLHLGWSEVEARLKEGGIPLLAADAAGTPVRDAEPGARWALVLGAEGQGCRRQVLDAAAVRVSIPMRRSVESLNVGVAGAILLYELTREITS